MASIIVDFRRMRCGHCKVAFKDELAECCPNCNVEFDGVSSNHVGLAEKLTEKRTGERPEVIGDKEAKYPDLVGS